MNRKKGFTLIEMAVVLLIIGILAGIVLRNVGSQGVVARDSKRLADINLIHNYAVQYLQAKGVFPPSTVDSWTELVTDITGAGIVDKLPTDPGGNAYDYFSCVTTGVTPAVGVPASHYIVQSTLEQTSTKAPALYKEAMTAMPTGFECYKTGTKLDTTSFGTNCTAANKFCSLQ